MVKRSSRVLALITLMALTSCRPADPRSAQGGFPPAPSPGGALYGRVLHADGRAAPRSAVELTQLRRQRVPGDPNPAARGLGFGCPASGSQGTPDLCVNRASARVRAEGAFTFPERSVRSGLRSIVTATFAPLTSTQWTGPETSAGLDLGRHGPGPQEVPDLFSWEPKLFFASGSHELRLRWTPLDVGLQSRAIRYTAEAVLGSSGSPVVRVAGPQASTTAVIDTRPFEDAGWQVVVVAETAVAPDVSNDRVVELTYRSGSQPVPGRAGAGPAPTRRRPCLTDDLRGRLQPVDPCPLTDGDLEQHRQVSFPTCPDDGSECVQTHQRLCVDLGEGEGRPVSLVVYRSHVPYDQAVVELTQDGKQFAPVARPPNVDSGNDGDSAGKPDDGEVVSIPVDPPQQATAVCLRGPFTGAALQELSAW